MYISILHFRDFLKQALSIFHFPYHPCMFFKTYIFTLTNQRTNHPWIGKNTVHTAISRGFTYHPWHSPPFHHNNKTPRCEPTPAPAPFSKRCSKFTNNPLALITEFINSTCGYPNQKSIPGGQKNHGKNTALEGAIKKPVVFLNNGRILFAISTG